MPAAAHAAWLAWYASTPDAPCIAICSTVAGRRGMQGLRPQLRGGAALAGLQPGTEARGVAPHHARRHRLALQPLCRARAAGQRRRPPAARDLRAPRPRCRVERGHDRVRSPRLARFGRAHPAAGLAGVHRPARGHRLRHRGHAAGGALCGARPGGAGGGLGRLHHGVHRLHGRGAWRPGRSSASSSARRSCTRPATSCTRRCGSPWVWPCWAARCWSFRGPSWPLSQATPEVEAKVRQYLLALAFALPAALLFAAYRGFNNAVSRPKAVMVIQLAGLGLKLPLSAALIFGVPALRIPELGVLGCGIATVIAMWLQVLAGLWVLQARPLLRALRAGRRRAAAARPPGHRRAVAAGRADGAVDPDRGHRLRLHGHLHRAPGRHGGGRPPARGQHGVGAVHAAAGAGQCHRHAGGAAHRRARPAWRAAPGLARAADRRVPGRGRRRIDLRAAPRRAAAVHRRRGRHRRGAAAAGLGGAVPHRRRGAVRGRPSCCAPTASPRCR